MTDVTATASVCAFLLATLAPYVMAAAVTGANEGADRRRLEIAVLGTAGLSAVLHVTAFTVGLTLARVLLLMAAATLVFAAARFRFGGLRSDRPGPAAPPLRWRWMESAATLVAVAVGASWLVSTTASLDVIGTDAAHYHIPHAVNYALGATPWDPLPTRHAYPMGTSLLFAWFILPFGDAFVVDAAMLIHAALLLAALAALFRSLTGDSGWTWAPWIVVFLLSMPLVVHAFLPSADLPYTAAFMAVTAQLVWMTTGSRRAVRDWLVLGCGMGLLIASKVTGVYSAAALTAVALAVPAARVLRQRTLGARVPGRTIVAGAAALCVGLVPGVLWLLRNWVVYGQPVETFPDRYYLSILGDLRTTYQNEWSYLFWRLSRRVTQWLGPWFTACGYAVFVLCAEAAWRLARKRGDALDRRRLGFLALATVVAAVHAAGMVGAPWTSFEHASGSSLRYILPVWVTWVMLGAAGLFSRQVAWYAHGGSRVAVWCLAGAMAVAAAWNSADPWWRGFATAPVAVLAVSGFAVLWGWSLSPGRAGGHRSLATVRSVGALVLVAALAAPWLVSRHEPLRREAAEAEQREIAGWPANVNPTVTDHRRAYLDTRLDESRRAVPCAARRFFVASRNDLPLAFQPAVYTSLIFDSRDAGAALDLLRHTPASRPCDYVVVLESELSRPFVKLASVWLAEVDTTGPFRVFRVTRP